MREKTSEIKLHIGVDVLGLTHAIIITTADVTDRSGAIDMVDYYCDYTDNRSQIKRILEAEVVKRNKLHTFAILPMRWIVERSFGWFDKCHRLWKKCERFLQHSFQMISLPFISIILKRY